MKVYIIKKSLRLKFEVEEYEAAELDGVVYWNNYVEADEEA